MKPCYKPKRGYSHRSSSTIKAPKTVNNFVFLARQGYYDNVTFHRVIARLYGPNGRPHGHRLRRTGLQVRGRILAPISSMIARGSSRWPTAGPNTNGSQFFITYAPQPHLDNLHTVFGKVIEGHGRRQGACTSRDPSDPSAKPGDLILSVEIVEK